VVPFRVQVWLTLQVIPHVTPQVVALFSAAWHPHSREELQRVLGQKDRLHFSKAYLEPLLAAGRLEMTMLANLWSRLQHYWTAVADSEAPQTISRQRP
jgi:hypothetical protein